MGIIPESAEIDLTLARGNVYFMEDPDFQDPIPHFFVILNVNPKTDAVVVLTYATSQVDKRKSWAQHIGAAETTLVEVIPGEYTNFNVPTIFDCNYPTMRTKDELVQLRKQKKLNPFQEPLPDEIVKKICQGVCDSDLVEQSIKDLL